MTEEEKREAWAIALRCAIDARASAEEHEKILRLSRPDSFLKGAHLINSVMPRRDSLRMLVRCSRAFFDEVAHCLGVEPFCGGDTGSSSIDFDYSQGTEYPLLRLEFELVEGFDGGEVLLREPIARPAPTGSPWMTARGKA